MASPILLPLSVIAIIIYFVYQHVAQRKLLAKYPPGPKPLPVFGNIFDMPPKAVPEFQHWLKHKDKYGPVSSLTILGKTLVFINSREAAQEILERNAHRTAGRPKVSYPVEAIGYGQSLAFRQHDDFHKRGRKAVHQFMGTQVAGARCSDALSAEVERYLSDVLADPGHLRKHLWSLSTAVVLRQTYGYSVGRTDNDPLVHLIRLDYQNAAKIAVPMAWMVDLFPAIQHIPDGLPGTGYRETAKFWSKILHRVVDIPFNFVKEQRRAGSDRVSYVSDQLEKLESASDYKSEKSGVSLADENFIKWTASTVQAAATDTTAANLEGFIAAMVMFPEVQARAQEEIDRVVGRDRLPCLEDRNQLPYVQALIVEVARWYAATPMGVPHMAQEDIVYGDHIIPKGACLMPAVWSFCHDPSVYEKPQLFDPTRFMEPRNELSPKPVTFGFGRRSCPGQGFAEVTMFLAVSATLSLFSVSRAVGEDGREIHIDIDKYSKQGIIRHPTAFPYNIQPRSASTATLIQSFEAQSLPGESDAELLKITSRQPEPEARHITGRPEKVKHVAMSKGYLF
ncbi:hypothetical protein HIM_06596 [Hirsutella minnesotensis 3608]|uniref:O-methylsterigmatocystin oxidoreductase n=1 Tax=Hirsutella minnesotensis 3608 TaxID=1043627 RepID=A0A0F7ZTY6_9HYPO|nr:hypothetical protein HIM_06596 [Hirsutella minnesotensis 3608]